MSALSERLADDEAQSVPRMNDLHARSTTPSLPFSFAEFKDRLHRVRKLMGEEGIELLFITGPDSMYYFHGYNARYYRGHGPTADPPIAATAIHVDHEDLIHFDYRMEETLLASTSAAEDFRWLTEGEAPEALAEAIMRELRGEGWLGGTVGMELASHLPNPAVSRVIQDAFRKSKVERVVDATRLIRSVRRVKSAQEIAFAKEAARICDVGHQAGKQVLRPGVTELEVLAEIVRAMYQAGGENPGIPNAVVSGPYLHLHGWTTRRKIQRGDFVVFDLSGVFNRYHSTAVRTYFLGDPPPQLIRLFRIVGGSMDLVAQVIKPGTSASSLCHALREYYQDRGVWGLYEWAGGFEFGIGFPPDCMGESYWTLDEDVPDSFVENEITTYYAQLNTQIADTYLVGHQRTSKLSSLSGELTVVD